jgi:hypothetical protein
MKEGLAGLLLDAILTDTVCSYVVLGSTSPTDILQHVSSTPPGARTEPIEAQVSVEVGPQQIRPKQFSVTERSAAAVELQAPPGFPLHRQLNSCYQKNYPALLLIRF